jgi:hypothetical protein
MRFKRTTDGRARPNTELFAIAQADNVLDRSKHGRPTRVGESILRSTWEANYAQYLEQLKIRGVIADWEYEADTFIFDGVHFGPLAYTPDFKVTGKDGAVAYHEVKGWMDRLSRLKLKRMAKFYPEVPVIIVEAAVCMSATAETNSARYSRLLK